MRAIGFHGTSAEAADRVLTSGFEISRNEYDWLGDGAYFFQDAPVRGMEWARERFGERAAVVGAEIDLDACVDLLDIPWEQAIVRTFQRYLGHLTRSGITIPRQTRRAHRLDRGVLNYLVDGMGLDGRIIRSVRAVFPEGEPMYAGSALPTRSHVQIAVRDRSAIIRTWRQEQQDAHAER